MSNIFYVYILFRHTGVPLYVGMGSGKRWASHEKMNDPKNSHKNIVIRETINMLGDLPKIKIAENLNKEDAFYIEKLMISIIGRRPIGPLVNLTDGGEGALNLSDEAKARIGAAASKFHRGKPRSKEDRDKISKSAKGRIFTPEHHKNLSLARQNRTIRQTQIENMKKSMKAKASDPEYRKKLSLSARGIPWK